MKEFLRKEGIVEVFEGVGGCFALRAGDEPPESDEMRSSLFEGIRGKI